MVVRYKGFNKLRCAPLNEIGPFFAKQPTKMMMMIMLIMLMMMLMVVVMVMAANIIATKSAVAQVMPQINIHKQNKQTNKWQL